jgi:hypothetical protein
MIVGPFYRQRPTASTTAILMAWCYLWLGHDGSIIAIEWEEP